MAQTDLRRLDNVRLRWALALTAAMMVIYFGFILLVAFDKPLLTRELNPGLFTIPFSFLVAVVVTLLWREPAAEAGFDDVERRVHFGEVDVKRGEQLSPGERIGQPSAKLSPASRR